MRHLAIALAAFFAFAPVVAGAQGTIEQRHYDVRGTTAKALYAAITVASPIGYSASTELRPGQLQWHARRTSRGYEVETARFDLRIVQTFPRWLDRDSARPCVRRQWDQAMAALRAHEDRHRERFAAYARQLTTEAKRLPPQPTPATLERALTALNARLWGEMQAWHHDYDRRTQHGRLEGVVLRPC